MSLLADLNNVKSECALWQKACLDLRRNIATLMGEIHLLRTDNDRLRDSEIRLREALSSTLEELQIMEEVLQEAHDEIGPPTAAEPLPAISPTSREQRSQVRQTCDVERQRSRQLREQSRELRERLEATVETTGIILGN